jgi:hypothetical protein
MVSSFADLFGAFYNISLVTEVSVPPFRPEHFQESIFLSELMAENFRDFFAFG